MTDFITSDPHFGHENIVNLEGGPFKHTNHRDSVLIRNWNETVTDDDTIYIAGDFSLRYARDRGYYEMILRKLNGKKILIPGNHEIEKYAFYCGDRGVGFWSLHYPYLDVDEFSICHDPSLALVNRKRWFLCGHVHDLFHIQKNVFNVGMVVNNWRPISLDQIREQIKDIEL